MNTTLYFLKIHKKKILAKIIFVSRPKMGTLMSFMFCCNNKPTFNYSVVFRS